jgi:hypothetical protein
MPKGTKHTPKQVVAILHQAEQGEAPEAVCRKLNFSEATQVKDMKAQYDENARLKRLVADQP